MPRYQVINIALYCYSLYKLCYVFRLVEYICFQYVTFFKRVLRLTPNQNQNYIFCILVKQQNLVVFLISYDHLLKVTIGPDKSSFCCIMTRSFKTIALALPDKRTRQQQLRSLPEGFRPDPSLPWKEAVKVPTFSDRNPHFFIAASSLALPDKKTRYFLLLLIQQQSKYYDPNTTII